MSSYESSGGYLLGHVLRFGQLLRLMGVDVSLSQMLDLAQALGYVPISNRLDFYHTSRALLVNRREDLPVFDQAFALFWSTEGSQPPDSRQSRANKLMRPRLPAQPDLGQSAGEDELGSERESPREGEEGDGEKQAEKQKTYSSLEVLRQKDFGEMSWEEIQAAKRAMANLDWKLGQRRTRRYRPNSKGRLNLRRIVRDNLRQGGEPIVLAYRARVYHPRPLVVLCDISGSMERYSRMLLHFVHTLTHGLTGVEVEAFVFGTRLTRITHHLRHKDVDESLDEVGKVVKDWSGGTRIGQAIKTFNFRWARRTLGRGAVVLIISDGWDRGDIQLLAREMARLQRSAYRLMWLNPMLGSGDYELSQRGMVAALPYLDDLLPGHNLASLEQLAQTLSSISAARPERKQRIRPPLYEALDSGELPSLDQRAERERLVRQVFTEYPVYKLFSKLGMEIGRENNC